MNVISMNVISINVISLLGLMALLAVAWGLSYHRRQVLLRPVLWGLGLQFLLALIILRRDAWSFVGLTLLGLLVVSFLDQQGSGAGQSIATLGRAGWRRIAVLCAAALAAGGLLTLLPGRMLGALALALPVVLLAMAWRPPSRLRRRLGMLWVVTGTAWVIQSQLYGFEVFQTLGEAITRFLNLASYGARFLFGNLADPDHFYPTAASWPGFGFQFAFYLLPVIIFFAAFMSVLYYFGIMQRVIEGVSRFMRWTIGTSGVETLSCSANMFIGQTEAPLLVRPYLATTTRSELLTIMVGGFSTVAGSGLAVYAAMGMPAEHLLAASIMSAPAALVIGKIIFPELETSATSGVAELPEIDVGGNPIEAASNGITDGLKLALNVGAMLIGFIALIACIDVLLNFLDGLIDGRLLGGEVVAYAANDLSPVTSEHRGVVPGSLRTLFGTLLAPLAWVMGVPWVDAAAVGHLLGVKLSLNEFVAYGLLQASLEDGSLSERSIIISTYALCGFANFSSIGIQIGGLGALAPERRSDLARLGLRAMFGGALASWLTATIAGILL
ncbi:MAG: nucleoside transporter C-terminal domain-containing protein [Acidobacteriota bacterium]